MKTQYIELRTSKDNPVQQNNFYTKLYLSGVHKYIILIYKYLYMLSIKHVRVSVLKNRHKHIVNIVSVLTYFKEITAGLGQINF